MSSVSRSDKRADILTAVIILVIVFVIGAVIYIGRTGGDAAGGPEAEALADCLTVKGARMYGTDWCTHCRDQKKMFGGAFSKIDYVECSTPGDPRKQAQACKDAGVTSYPTWVFDDGSRLSGAIPLKELADKAGCPFGEQDQVEAPVAPAAIQDPAAAVPAAEPAPAP